MRLNKLIVFSASIAVLAMLAPHANAQTMGEYATTVGVASGGGSSMGTSIGSTVGSDDLGGGSRTWGASSLGESFDERAGAASASGAGAGFDSRAGSMTGGSASESRWPGSQLKSSSSDRFGGSSDRLSTGDRFAERNELTSSSADRFPASQFNDNRMGLDTSYSHSGLDNGNSRGGLDNSYNPINY